MRQVNPAMQRVALSDAHVEGGFNLEDAAAQLLDAFAHITILRYDDAIRLTEAAPLVAYAQASSHIDATSTAAFSTLVQAAIDRNGILEIPKRAGLFVCQT